MAHTLILADGTTSLDLAVAGGTGIYLRNWRPPPPLRVAVRNGPAPTVPGRRTIVSSSDDVTAELLLRIVGTSADNVEAQLITLTRLLERARAWEEDRTGSPVHLAWKRANATEIAYWTVTGVPGMPATDGDADWLDVENASNMLTIRITLALEPVPHEITYRTAVSPLDISLTPGVAGLLVVGSSVGGDLAAPFAVSVKKRSAGNDWTTAWLAELASIPDMTDYSGTVEAGTLNGQVQEQAYTGTVLTFTGSGYTIDASKQYPIRAFVRMKVTVGTANLVQVRLKVNLGTATGTPITLPWITFAGVAGSWFLVDLGTLPLLSALQGRVYQTATSYFATVEVQTSDGSNATVRLDYTEFLSYFGFARLEGVVVVQNDAIYYEDILTSEAGAYAMPRQATQAYQAVAATGVAVREAQRYGRLRRIPPASTAYLWFQAQSGTAHLIADTATWTFKHLQLYALGLRGAG